MLGYIRHKKPAQAQIPATHYGRDWEARRKLNTYIVLVVCLYLAKAFRENCVLAKQSQADGITSSKAKILQTHYAEDPNSLTELNANMKHTGYLSKTGEFVSKARGHQATCQQHLDDGLVFTFHFVHGCF